MIEVYNKQIYLSSIKEYANIVRSKYYGTEDINIWLESPHGYIIAPISVRLSSKMMDLLKPGQIFIKTDDEMLFMEKDLLKANVFKKSNDTVLSYGKWYRIVTLVNKKRKEKASELKGNDRKQHSCVLFTRKR